VAEVQCGVYRRSMWRDDGRLDIIDGVCCEEQGGKCETGTAEVGCPAFGLARVTIHQAHIGSTAKHSWWQCRLGLVWTPALAGPPTRGLLHTLHTITIIAATPLLWERHTQLYRYTKPTSIPSIPRRNVGTICSCEQVP
jgi:hypothetical protein